MVQLINSNPLRLLDKGSQLDSESCAAFANLLNKRSQVQPALRIQRSL
ncbi:hypothetical protein LBWT_X4270 (plasmid) [Leptolyngbya boryana IAM M-101]|nr:hypothetical protein LBWT_X4270 [Leptolyngbya boryana IAM M-101]BAS66703.1 hypothetical protein LBDG_X4270 [Leptolyngbya boryana dg5]